MDMDTAEDYQRRRFAAVRRGILDAAGAAGASRPGRRAAERADTEDALYLLSLLGGPRPGRAALPDRGRRR